MSDTDLTYLTPDAARFGANIARTMRIIAKLLLDWSAAERSRKDKDKIKDNNRVKAESCRSLPCLKAIYFDKLVMFFCRLWNRLHEDDQVRYRTGFIQRRGFHGPGQALKINRTEDEKIGMGKYPYDYRHNQYAFTIEIIEKLKPGIGNARSLFRLDELPWSAKCKVYPQLEDNMWDLWCFNKKTEKDDTLFLNPKELTYLSVISSALTNLSSMEIRVIGTHCSAIETCKDIEFNLAAWKKYFNSILEAIGEQGKEEIEASISRLVTTSREICRKSIDNRDVYKNAFEKYVQRISAYQVIMDSFKAVQNDVNSIWQDERIIKYANISPILLALSLYCKRALYVLKKIKKLGIKEIKESNKYLINLKNWSQKKGLTLLDYEVLKNRTNSKIVEMLQNIRNEIMREMPDKEDIKGTGI